MPSADGKKPAADLRGETRISTRKHILIRLIGVHLRLHTLRWSFGPLAGSARSPAIARGKAGSFTERVQAKLAEFVKQFGWGLHHGFKAGFKK
jgi:hypothetical protein